MRNINKECRNYKYSNSGLSHKFNPEARVLEMMNTEDKVTRTCKLRKFKELEEIGDNDITIIIEHWY